MPTQEIQSTDWQKFCEKFLNLHRGSIMTVEQITPAGARVEVVNKMPLRNISISHGDCSDSILLDFQQDGSREIIHEIVEPIHVKLREEGHGQKGLQIDAESGTTIVLFSSGKLDELLQGLHLER
jgi:hypothetical protein